MRKYKMHYNEEEYYNYLIYLILLGYSIRQCFRERVTCHRGMCELRKLQWAASVSLTLKPELQLHNPSLPGQIFTEIQNIICRSSASLRQQRKLLSKPCSRASPLPLRAEVGCRGISAMTACSPRSRRSLIEAEGSGSLLGHSGLYSSFYAGAHCQGNVPEGHQPRNSHLSRFTAL